MPNNRITIALSNAPHLIPTNELLLDELCEINNQSYEDERYRKGKKGREERSKGDEQQLMMNMIRELSKKNELIGEIVKDSSSRTQTEMECSRNKNQNLIWKEQPAWLLEIDDWWIEDQTETEESNSDSKLELDLDLDNLREAMSDNHTLSFNKSNSKHSSNSLSTLNNLSCHFQRSNSIINPPPTILSTCFKNNTTLPPSLLPFHLSSHSNRFSSFLPSHLFHSHSICSTLSSIQNQNQFQFQNQNQISISSFYDSNSFKSPTTHPLQNSPHSISNSISFSQSQSPHNNSDLHPPQKKHPPDPHSSTATLLAGLFDSFRPRNRPRPAHAPSQTLHFSTLNLSSSDPLQIPSPSLPSPSTNQSQKTSPASIDLSSSLISNPSLSLLLDHSSLSTHSTCISLSSEFQHPSVHPLSSNYLPSTTLNPSQPLALLSSLPNPDSTLNSISHSLQHSNHSSSTSALSSSANSLLLPPPCLPASSGPTPSLEEMDQLIHNHVCLPSKSPISHTSTSSPLQSSSMATTILSNASHPFTPLAPPNPSSSCPSLSSAPQSSSSSSHHQKPRTSSASLKSPVESFITTSKTLPTLATQPDNLLVLSDRSQLHMSPTARLSSRRTQLYPISSEPDAVTRLTRQRSVASRTTSIDSHPHPLSNASSHTSHSLPDIDPHHCHSDDDLPNLSASYDPLVDPLTTHPPLVSPAFSSSTIGGSPFLPPPNDLMMPPFMRSLSNPQSVSANSSGSYQSSPGPPQMKSHPQVKLTTTQPATTKAYLSTAKGTLGKALGLRTVPTERQSSAKGVEPNLTTVPTTAFGRLPSLSGPPSSASSSLPSSLILPSKTSSTSVTAPTLIFSGSQLGHQHGSEASFKNRIAHFSARATSQFISQTSSPGHVSQLSKPNAVFLPPLSNTTMELSTFTNPHSNPPPFSVFGHEPAEEPRLAPGGAVGDEEPDGQPIVDRFGFIVDARYGVKLVRQARDKQKRNQSRMTENGQHRECLEQAPELVEDRRPTCVSDPSQDLQSGDEGRQGAQLVAPPTSKPVQQRCKSSEFEQTPIMTTALPIKSQVDVEAELVSLREALGLPAATATAQDVNTSASKKGKSAAVDGDEVTAGVVPKRVESTTQSVKRLLVQLNEMHSLLEQSQMVAWTQFIAKRQLKLVKASGPAAGVVGGVAGGENKVLGAASVSAESVGVFLGVSQGKAIGGGLTSGAMGMGTAGSSAGGLTGANQAGESGVKHRDVITCHDANLIGIASMGVLNNHNSKALKEDWRAFRALVAKGVPVALRPRIWLECSGASEVMEPGYYAELLEAHKGEEGLCLSQIECDVTRTLPTNVYFGGDGPGVDKLRRVLAAMSWHNPTVGYCQGMNMVAATLLLTIPSEEDAFWILVCIVDKILPADYYTSHLLTSQADQRVLRDLVDKYLPELWDHFDALEIELPAITFGWFLSLFADALPIQTLLRVFDLFLIDGSLLLFRIALGLLELNKPMILSQDSPASLYAYMRGPMTLSCHHADRLIGLAVGKFGVVKKRIVSGLREKYVGEIRSEMGI